LDIEIRTKTLNTGQGHRGARKSLFVLTAI